MKLNETISKIITRIFIVIIGVIAAKRVLLMFAGHILKGVLCALLLVPTMVIGKGLNDILFRN